MKNSKKLKLILMILICVLIILVGVVGIYTKTGISYKNIIPEYILASDIKGTTILEFEVDNSKETIYYDKEGKKVDSSEVTEENKKDYTTKEAPANLEENLNEENYNKSMDIMKERLDFLAADQYNLDLDEKTGKIVLTVDDDYIEDIQSILPMQGSLQLIDSNTGDIIIDNTNFKSAEGTYASTPAGNNNVKYTAYINLELNDTGIEKINNIDKYKTTTSENGETTVNKLKVMFDGDELAEISYDNIVLTGKVLRVTTAKDLISDTEINSKLNTNTVVSKLATIGKMPVVYNLTVEEFMKNGRVEYINYIVIGVLAICAIVSLYFIFRYKSNGLLGVIAFATNISLFLIIIRLTKIEISLNSFAGILGLIVLYTTLANNIVKAVNNKESNFGENVKNAWLKSIDILVVSLILIIVFAFANMSLISTMGLLLFWGWLITIIGNLIFTIPMLSIVNKN